MADHTPEEIREEFRQSLRQPKLSTFLLFTFIIEVYEDTLNNPLHAGLPGKEVNLL